MTFEDEIGTARVIISPDFYDENRMTVLHERFVMVSGLLQNQVGVVHLKARTIAPLIGNVPAVPSHEFR
jgi:error-prone DNA polymerase